jgi:hypothetical protein
MSSFEPQTVEDHATTPIRGLRRLGGMVDASDSMSVRRTKKTRIATATITSGVQQRVEELKRSKVPFWQLAPDGKTIERAYDTAQEPIVIS